MKKAESETNDGPAPSNAFIRVLQVHGKGEVANELAEALKQAVMAVATIGKPASITLTAKVVPAAKGAYGIAFGAPKVTLPKTERPVSLWYGDEEHNLHRNDPRQEELPLRTVLRTADNPDAPLQQVAAK